MTWRERLPATLLRPRTVKIGFALVVTLAIACWAVLYGYAWYGRRTAERLLSDIRRIEYGSRFSDVEHLIAEYGLEVSEYGPCDGHGCTFGAVHRRGWADRLVNDLNWLRYLGLRPFWYGASIRQQGGHIVSTSFWAVAEVEPAEWGSVSTDMSEARWRELAIHNKERGRLQSERYDIGWSHLHVGWETGESIPITLSLHATPEEKTMAYGFDLSCFTRFGGCGHACRLAPDAWTVRQKFLAARGEGFVPAACAELFHSVN